MDLSVLDTAINTQISVELRHVSEVLSSSFEIVKVIGTGGMGNVYLAKDKKQGGEYVAIKVLHKEYCSESSLLTRFTREADLLKKVSNPNVVKVIDAGSNSEITYYVMEYVPGITLDDYLKSNKFPLEKLPNFIVKICEALSCIHAEGIIHRDLKPANIILSESLDPKIADFGIARVENSQLTHHNEILGSVYYIAPEIWIGEEPTHSVDLYGLGIILYEIVTGKIPFDGNSPGDLMRKHLQSQAIPPKDINPEIPSYISRLIIRLLSKQRSERPKDALEVIHIIQRHMSVSSQNPQFRAYRADTQEFLRTVDENTAGALSKRQKTDLNMSSPHVTNSTSVSISKNFNQEVNNNNIDETRQPLEDSVKIEENSEDISLKKFVKILSVIIFVLLAIASSLYFI